MRRKFLSVVLCVCMMLTMAPFAFAAGETEIQASTTELSDGSYILKNDITLTSGALTIPKNATVSINLNNHKLTNKNGDHTILNNGTLTITGRGTVDNVSNGTAALYNNAGATATLNGGTYTRSCEASTSADNSGGNSYYTLKNFGTMTINPGVTVNQGADGNGKYSSLIANGWYDGSTQGQDAKEPAVQNDGAKMTINGGTFNGGLNTIKNDDYGTLTINSGTFQNYAQHAFFNANVATINGGTFVNDGTRGVIYTYAKWNDTYGKGTLDINGGIFVNKGTSIIEKSATNATVNITGGVFSSQVAGSTEKGSLYVYPSTNAVAGIDSYTFSNVADAVYAAVEGETITLLQNAQIYKYEEIRKSLTFDLGGHTLSSISSGFDVYSNFTLKNGTLNTDAWGVWVQNEGVKFTLASDATINADRNTTLTSASGVVVVQNASADLYGTVTAQHNFAVAGNGSNGYGGVTINVMPGANISTTEDSPALYFPNTTNLNISGGSITGGTGAYVKSGTVTISDGTITGNGPKASYVFNGNGANSTGDALVVETCKYPGGAPTVSITGGYFKSVNANAIGSYAGNGETTPITGFITGGYFTTDPTPYCGTKDGKQLTGVASKDSSYPYTVGEKNAESKPATVDSATVPAKAASSDATVQEAANSISGAKLENSASMEAAVKDIANNNKFEATSNTTGESTVLSDLRIVDPSVTSPDNVSIVYQTYIDITVTDAKKDTDKFSELAVNLTPMYRVVATKQDNVTSDATLVTEGDGQNAVVIQAGQPLNNVPVNNYKVKLALPSGFASKDAKLSIKHTKGNGSVEYYTGTVSTEGEEGSAKTYVTFTTNGFSPFVIYAASANVASIGDGENEQVFTSFQAAVDAVENGGTIKALKNIDSTVSGNKSFKVNANDKTVKLIAASGYNLTNNGDTYTVSRQSSGGPGSSGGSISTPTTYAVNVNAATNGAVAADKKTASKGTTVTVTASPSKGYVVDAVKVVDKDGKDVAVTGKDGKYVFTMPGSAVTVTGTFKAETPAPAALPFTDVKSGNWFYDAVKYAYEQGLMTGTSATTFAPNGTMNRAMIVTVLYRLEKSPAVTGASKFTDVPAGQWYSDAVAWAAANKIVNGYDETTFGPMNAVTREQMAAILFRYEQVKGLENVTLEENLNRFPDQNKISAYAIPALQWAVGQKIINGNADGTLDPTGTATRAQVAQIFTNLLNK